jgi:hypothetical protein
MTRLLASHTPSGDVELRKAPGGWIAAHHVAATRIEDMPRVVKECAQIAEDTGLPVVFEGPPTRKLKDPDT